MNLTSSKNPRIKQVIKLRTRKVRTALGMTIVEGRREIQRALESGQPIEEIYICSEKRDTQSFRKILQKIASLDVKIFYLKEILYKKIAYGERKEGILAVISPAIIKLEDLPARASLFVVVEGVEKPGNLGAMIRTCDGAGADAVLVCDPQTDIYNPNVIRASLGTVFSVPVIQDSRENIKEFLNKNKITIFASSPGARLNYTKANFKQASALIVGSEDQGLSSDWINNTHTRLKIPMLGKADSLNVSASAAILLYEAIRQRAG